MEVLKFENWSNIWGIIILLGMPILFGFATMIYKRRKPKGHGLVPPQIIRLLLIPFLTTYLIITKIIGISTEHLGSKILITIISLILISFLFNAINYLFFSENNILTKKEIIPKLGRDVLHIIAISIISACVLSRIWNLDLGNLLTALGVSSLVIGLALQEPLGNLFNGVSLLMANPFKKGDWIKVGDEIGKVAEINWRSVKVHTRLNEQIILPNNMLGKEKIKNLSRPNKIHAELLEFGFGYNDSPEKVKSILLEVAKNNPNVLSEPLPIPITISLDDFAITYGLKFYIKDYQDVIVVRDEIITSVFNAAEENQLTIPYPRQDISITMEK